MHILYISTCQVVPHTCVGSHHASTSYESYSFRLAVTNYRHDSSCHGNYFTNPAVSLLLCLEKVRGGND